MARTPQPSLVYLDTHIVIWLHDGLVDLLSTPAVETIEAAERLAISPIVELEIQYLHEIGRFRPAAVEAIGVLATEIGLQLGEIPFRQVVRIAANLSWTRDPFDRMIVAEAIAAQGKLVSKDTVIRTNSELAIW